MICRLGQDSGGMKFKNRIQSNPEVCGELILLNFFSHPRDRTDKPF